MSELTKRILFGLPAALVFIGVLWVGDFYFETVIGLIAAITVWEVSRITKLAFVEGFTVLVWFIALFIWFADRIPQTALFPIGAILILTTLFALLKSKREFSKRWFATLFCSVYAPLGFLMLVQIRETGSGLDGFWLTLVVVLMIWGNDVFAYFGGKNFGKTPLAPKVSPNKTWEGFWSGFIGAFTGLLIVFLIADPFPLSLMIMLPVVIIISVFGPLGDLTESKLKRLAGVKDSSSILPGHGGLFDRFDALILASPFVFFYFWIFM